MNEIKRLQKLAGIKEQDDEWTVDAPEEWGSPKLSNLPVLSVNISWVYEQEYEDDNGRKTKDYNGYYTESDDPYDIKDILTVGYEGWDTWDDEENIFVKEALLLITGSDTDDIVQMGTNGDYEWDFQEIEGDPNFNWGYHNEIGENKTIEGNITLNLGDYGTISYDGDSGKLKFNRGLDAIENDLGI